MVKVRMALTQSDPLRNAQDGQRGWHECAGVSLGSVLG